MSMYHKEKLLEVAIDLLRVQSVEIIETIDIESTTYDDGSSSLTITVDRPAKEEGSLFVDTEPLENIANLIRERHKR